MAPLPQGRNPSHSPMKAPADCAAATKPAAICETLQRTSPCLKARHESEKAPTEKQLGAVDAAEAIGMRGHRHDKHFAQAKTQYMRHDGGEVPAECRKISRQAAAAHAAGEGVVDARAGQAKGRQAKGGVMIKSEKRPDPFASVTRASPLTARHPWARG